MAEVWNVPGRHRPGFLPRLARSLLVVTVLGAGLVATTTLSGVGTISGPAVLARLLTLATSLGVNTGVFVAGFRFLTPKKIATRDLVPGAVLAAAAWTALQGLGGFLLTHQLRHTSQVYGFFAIVLGLLWFLFLGAQLTIYAAELNVVRVRRLWPRSLVQPPLTPSDRIALRQLAEKEERRPEQRVEVRFLDERQRPPT
jgi:uncharacterized BrkB/YihY/UPF0761 family membrane protein